MVRTFTLTAAILFPLQWNPGWRCLVCSYRSTSTVNGTQLSAALLFVVDSSSLFYERLVVSQKLWLLWFLRNLCWAPASRWPGNGCSGCFFAVLAKKPRNKSALGGRGYWALTLKPGPGSGRWLGLSPWGWKQLHGSDKNMILTDQKDNWSANNGVRVAITWSFHFANHSNAILHYIYRL